MFTGKRESEREGEWGRRERGRVEGGEGGRGEREREGGGGRKSEGVGRDYTTFYTSTIVLLE